MKYKLILLYPDSFCLASQNDFPQCVVCVQGFCCSEVQPLVQGKKLEHLNVILRTKQSNKKQKFQSFLNSVRTDLYDWYNHMSKNHTPDSVSTLFRNLLINSQKAKIKILKEDNKFSRL